MPTPPAYNGNGPKPGAAEPYLMLPEKAQPPGATAKEPMLPPAVPTTPVLPAPSYVEPMSYVPSGPPEPYTVYEGPRSAAEAKQDQTQMWVQANYIFWWVRRDNTPPLVTTGPAANPTAGALGNADTGILLGNGSIGPTQFSGAQLYTGMWLDPERLVAVEAGGFWLGTNSRQYAFASNPGSNQVLAVPVTIAGKEVGLPFSLPGFGTGSTGVSSTMSMNGGEFNFARNAFRTDGWTVDYFAGVRYIYLNDTMTMDTSSTALVPGAILFNGVGQPAGSNVLLHDSFNATNRFYGGQLGLRANYTWCGFDIGGVLKLGAGATSHVFIIDGASSLNGGAPAPGGILAQNSNIGRHTGTDFSFVPEFNLTVGYQVTSHVRVTAGYNMLYWTHVERVGNNIDRNVDPIQVPTLAFPAVGAGVNPTFPNVRTDFWAQGLNLGVELKF